jgi:hypothetical protein
MKCEKEELIAKACSTLVAHIGEGQMINNTRKPEQKKRQFAQQPLFFSFLIPEFKNTEPDKE